MFSITTCIALTKYVTSRLLIRCPGIKRNRWVSPFLSGIIMLASTEGSGTKWWEKTRRAAYPISQHVVIQCSARFQPNAFPGVFIREKQPIVRSWKINRETYRRQGDDEAITDIQDPVCWPGKNVCLPFHWGNALFWRQSSHWHQGRWGGVRTEMKIQYPQTRLMFLKTSGPQLC